MKIVKISRILSLTSDLTMLRKASLYDFPEDDDEYDDSFVKELADSLVRKKETQDQNKTETTHERQAAEELVLGHVGRNCLAPFFAETPIQNKSSIISINEILPTYHKDNLERLLLNDPLVQQYMGPEQPNIVRQRRWETLRNEINTWLLTNRYLGSGARIMHIPELTRVRNQESTQLQTNPEESEEEVINRIITSNFITTHIVPLIIDIPIEIRLDAGSLDDLSIDSPYIGHEDFPMENRLDMDIFYNELFSHPEIVNFIMAENVSEGVQTREHIQNRRQVAVEEAIENWLTRNGYIGANAREEIEETHEEDVVRTLVTDEFVRHYFVPLLRNIPQRDRRAAESLIELSSEYATDQLPEELQIPIENLVDPYWTDPGLEDFLRGDELSENTQDRRRQMLEDAVDEWLVGNRYIGPEAERLPGTEHTPTLVGDPEETETETAERLVTENFMRVHFTPLLLRIPVGIRRGISNVWEISTDHPESSVPQQHRVSENFLELPVHETNDIERFLQETPDQDGRDRRESLIISTINRWLVSHGFIGPNAQARPGRQR